MADAPVRVFVVEDQPAILRAQLKILSSAKELQIIGSAMSGEQALEDIPQDTDVVLCDLGLPGIDGIEVTRQIKERQPTTEVLIFTIFEEEEKVLGAVRAGAAGYLLKGAERDTIVSAIQDVNSGGSLIQPTLARLLMEHFKVDTGAFRHADPSLEPLECPLTKREVEILQVISRGLSNAEAAEVLDLSRATVRTHLEHIYEKLEVSNRVEAVTEGIRHGLIDL